MMDVCRNSDHINSIEIARPEAVSRVVDPCIALAASEGHKAYHNIVLHQYFVGLIVNFTR